MERSMTSSVLSIGMMGVQRGVHGLQREAHKIANTANNGFDAAGIAESLVNAKQYRHSVEASMHVIERADRARRAYRDVFTAIPGITCATTTRALSQ
jgi:hypothetical protein